MNVFKRLPVALLLSAILAVGPACNGDDGGPNGNGGIAELEAFWDLSSLAGQIGVETIEFVSEEGWSGFLEIGAGPDEYEIAIRDEFGATIEDTKNNRVWAMLEQVKVASRQFSVDAVGVVAKDITFNAIRMKDESEV